MVLRTSAAAVDECVCSPSVFARIFKIFDVQGREGGREGQRDWNWGLRFSRRGGTGFSLLETRTWEWLGLLKERTGGREVCCRGRDRFYDDALVKFPNYGSTPCSFA